MQDPAFEYEDVMFYLEQRIIGFYREHPDLVDHNVDKALEMLVRTYEAEAKDKRQPRLRLRGLEEPLFEVLKNAAERLMGRKEAESEEDKPPRQLTIDVMINLFKRLRSSIRLWTGSAAYGRQGYLNFVSGHIPE